MTWRYVVRRTAEALTVVFGVLCITFVVVHAAPGDPFIPADNPQAVSTEAAQVMRTRFGLDRPLPEQFVRYVGNVLRADLGVSFQERRPVTAILADALPYTIVLATAGLGINFVVGVAIGVVQAVRYRSRTDHIWSLVTLTVFSLPSFWVGLLCIQVFAILLGWLPSSGASAAGVAATASVWTRWTDNFLHLILPAGTLGLVGAAWVARYQRGALLDVLNSDFVRAARGRGLKEKTVIARHALRNALLPTITLLGLSLPALFSGAVLIETVFNWPGLGRIAATALSTRDHPVVLGAAVLAAVMVVLGNLLADLTYRWVDPRTREEA